MWPPAQRQDRQPNGSEHDQSTGAGSVLLPHVRPEFRMPTGRCVDSQSGALCPPIRAAQVGSVGVRHLSPGNLA